MSNQNGLTVLGKQHQISFPMAWLSAFVDVGWALLDRYTPLDVIDGAAASVSTPPSLTFSPGQVVPPTKIVGAPDLSIDEPIDRLIADDRTLLFFLQSTAYLGRRPALFQPFEHLSLKIRIAQQSTALPATALSLLLCVGRLITHLPAAVALKFTRYSRWRAIHSCRDLADCLPGLAKSGKCTALFKRKLFIASSHCNTLSKKCCTSFVNLGALNNNAEEVWQEALNGLVAFSSPASLKILQSARSRKFTEETEAKRFNLWLEEAIQQVEFELRSKV